MSESTWNPFLQLVRPSQWKIKKQSRLLLGRYRRIETEWWPNQSAKESTIFAPPPLIVTGSSFPLKRTQPTKSLAAFQEWKKKDFSKDEPLIFLFSPSVPQRLPCPLFFSSSSFILRPFHLAPVWSVACATMDSSLVWMFDFILLFNFVVHHIFSRFVLFFDINSRHAFVYNTIVFSFERKSCIPPTPSMCWFSFSCHLFLRLFLPDLFL